MINDVRPMFDICPGRCSPGKYNNLANFCAALRVHEWGGRCLSKHRPIGRWRLTNKDNIYRKSAPLDSPEIDAMLYITGRTPPGKSQSSVRTSQHSCSGRDWEIWPIPANAFPKRKTTVKGWMYPDTKRVYKHSHSHLPSITQREENDEMGGMFYKSCEKD